MQVLKFALALLAATLIHGLGPRWFPNFPRVADLFMVVVVLHALRRNTLGGMTGGLIAGLVQDALTSGPFGVFGFADTIVGYFTARAGQRLVIQKASGVMLVVMAAVAAQQLILFVLYAFFLGDRSFPDPLWFGLRIVATGLLGLASQLGGETFGRARESRRRSRVDRLRLGG